MTPDEDPKKERQSWDVVRKYAPGVVKAVPSVVKAIEAVRNFGQ